MNANKSAFAATLLFVTALFVSGVAGAVPIISQAGSGVCTLGPLQGGGSCTTENIAAHALWQTANPFGRGAQWVSYADTGIDGSTLAPIAGSLSNPSGTSIIFSIEETFSFGAYGGFLSLSVWADDTANVYIDGQQYFQADFTQDICSTGIGIGCEPGEAGIIQNLALGMGTHTILIELFQTGIGTTPQDNPFGVLYSGVATAAIPEPTSALVFAAGLLAIRRRLVRR